MTSDAEPIVVLGGGLAGLTAAFDLHRAGRDVEVHEASDRFGGKIASSPVGDRLVDAGADAFLARVPQGKALCEQLGLTDQLTSPVAPVPAYLHRAGKLRPLPEATMLGVPTDLDALAASGTVSTEAVARAGLDLTLPATSTEGDISVGAYFRQRLGDEITERLLDPMIGGINASDIDRLSLQSASPQLAAAAGRHRSIIEGVRELRASLGAALGSGNSAPVFHGLTGGTASIIDALVDHLPTDRLHLTSPSLLPGTGPTVVATPAPAAAELLATVAPRTSALLAQIEYASVAQVTVELPTSAVDPVLDASGILFPRVDGMIITACTWFSTKWQHYARPDSVLLRMTSGRFGDRRALELDDETLTATLLGELQTVIDIADQPFAVRVHRWFDALPQYVPGHAQRVADIFTTLAEEAPHITLAGAAYRGIGIPATIQSGHDAAEVVLANG